MSYEINDERMWRISKSGFSIKTGWGDNKRIIAAYPGLPTAKDTDRFQQWLDDAEMICDLYNASLEKPR